jgi:hypothetical protein
MIWRSCCKKMPTDLHFICQHRQNHRSLGNQVFETWEWSVSDEVAQEAVGGRLYLHEHQKRPAWHGGTITGWRPSGTPGRKIFTYTVDEPFRIICPGNWGQEKAIVRR